MVGLGNYTQAGTLAAGVALCIVGVYESVKVDAATGAAMIAGGLALIFAKEAVGSKPTVAA